MKKLLIYSILLFVLISFVHAEIVYEEGVDKEQCDFLYNLINDKEVKLICSNELNSYYRYKLFYNGKTTIKTNKHIIIGAVDGKSTWMLSMYLHHEYSHYKWDYNEPQAQAYGLKTAMTKHNRRLVSLYDWTREND